MESSLGWVDLSPAALRRLRQELDPETEGVVDEMGVGALHTGYADHFFPGLRSCTRDRGMPSSRAGTT